MRPLPFLLLLALVLVLQSSSHVVRGDSPKPSDTNNQPGTTKPPGATPAPTTKPPGAATPAPTTATTKPPPAATTPTPAPTPATPAPAATNTTEAPVTTEPPATDAPSTTEPTTAVPIESPDANTSTQTNSNQSSGMGTGAIVGIVLACVGLVAIIAFFVYRHVRARREDAKHYGLEYDAASPPMTVLESSRNNDNMYAVMDAVPSKHMQRPTNTMTTPTDDIVIMTKYATPSSPKFAQNPPQLSPPPFQQEIADFTKSVNNYTEKSMPSTEFQSSYRESDAESYAGGASYTGGGSFMHSFDQGGVSAFRDTLNAEQTTQEQNKEGHWMEAMDEMRDTNDSYAMLEANGSFNSRGSAMRFSNESDLRG